MALKNVMRVDGGHVVTGGGAGESGVEIDWEDWCELTPEEQETGDWTIINCPWADGNVSIDLMTKLWENPNPTAEFAAQNILLDLSKYQFIMVVTYDSSPPTLCRVGEGSQLQIVGRSNATSTQYGTKGIWRGFSTDSTRVVFDDALIIYTTVASYVINTHLIPYQIYGIKLTATVKINAIAMDVSTSADKCMLSDGVTSVEDILADTGWVQIGTTGVYYRKIGKQVTIKGTVTTGTSWTTIATLPKGYRPASNIYRGLYSANNGYASLFIGPTGVIQSAGTSAIQFMESFLID